MQQRQGCVNCGSHTYRDTCGTCGSIDLSPIIPGREDLRRVGDLPLSMKALRRFQRDVVDAPSDLVRV